MESVVGGLEVSGIVKLLFINHLVGQLPKLLLAILQPGAAVKSIGWQCKKFIVDVGKFLSDLVESRFHVPEVSAWPTLVRFALLEMASSKKEEQCSQCLLHRGTFSAQLS